MGRNRKKADAGKYKSHFELEISGKMPDESYEATELKYTIPATEHIYIPDWTVTATDGHSIYLESKGRFRTKAEADKYLLVRDSNPDIDLRFIIQSDKTLMPRSKKTTMKQWLKKNGFVVYVWPNVPNIAKL